MQRRCDYTRLFFTSSCYVLFIWLFISAYSKDDDWTTQETFHNSGTHFFACSYVTNNRIRRTGKVFGHNMNFISKITTVAIASQKLKQQHQRNVAATRTTQLNMCICINCARVINCSAYYFVETKHEQPHIAVQPTFTPRDGSPRIHVNIRTPGRTSFTKSTTDATRASIDENNRIWSEEMKLVQRAKSISNTDSTTEDGDETTAAVVGESGETVIPISTTYTEYDVVACSDYVEDMNCWTRNMPDEIKRANPNFVPT
jgi:hypothetical protein